jgi:ABC-2 type transport system permease protein
MKAFKAMLKMESKLTLRGMDSIFFGVLFPMGLALILGIIYGNKPAYEGADYTFIQQSFGAVISIGICATGLMGIPLSVSEYRHRKILKRFRVTPVSPGLLLFTQMTVQLMIAVLSSLGVFTVMKLFFGYRMEGSFAGFVLSYLLVMFAIYGLGMMLGSVAPNVKTANLLCSLVYFPMLFLSGATVPYEVMPPVMQRVTNVLPLTQGIKLLKGFSLGMEPENLVLSIAVMAGLAVVTTIISIKFFRWE